MSATITDAFEYAVSRGYLGTQEEFSGLMALALKYESTNNKDLGIVTAYGYAKSKGFTGTEEEFAELMASYATVAQDVIDTGADVARMYQKFGDLITENAVLYRVSIENETICFESKRFDIEDDPDFDPHQGEDYVVNESLYLD